MKIKVGRKVYLQRYDLIFIFRKLSYMPAEVVEEFSGKNMHNAIKNDDPEAKLKFDCVFEKAASVNWLMDQNWILDYDEFNQMPMVDVKALLCKIDADFHEQLDWRRRGDMVYRISTSLDIDRKKHMIDSLELMIEYKEGRMRPSLPAEITKKKFNNNWLKSIFRLFNPNAR